MIDSTILLLSMRQLQTVLGIRSRSTIYHMVANKTLPPPCVINRRGVRWRASDIQKWVSDLPSSDPKQMHTDAYPPIDR